MQLKELDWDAIFDFPLPFLDSAWCFSEGVAFLYIVGPVPSYYHGTTMGLSCDYHEAVTYDYHGTTMKLPGGYRGSTVGAVQLVRP